MRRLAAVLASFALLTGGGIAASALLATDGPDAVSMAEIVCEKDGTRVLTPEVVAQAEGLRLEIRNVGRERQFELVPLGSDIAAVGGQLPRDSVTETSFAIPPGPVEVTCGPKVRNAAASSTGRLTLLDPQGLWIVSEPDCAHPERSVLQTDYRQEPAEQTLRRTAAGMFPEDAVVKPGYPGTQWHGDLVVVIRGDETIARALRALNHASWEITIDACPGSQLVPGV